MRALWLEDQQLSYREDVTPPGEREGEAVVRVRLAGICGTDLELCRGYYPYRGVIGHEFVGEIVSAPAAPERVGQRVVGEINAACGDCSLCRSGMMTHCPQRTVLGIVGRDGAFADQLSLPLRNLLVVPDDVADECAVFTEPLAAALQLQTQLSLGPGRRVLLVGAGRLGQLIAATLALTGCELQVVARYARQRELLEARGVEVIEQTAISQRTFDVAIDATGSPAGFATARQAVRPRGTIALKSTYSGQLQLDASALVVDEITVVGSRCGRFAPALRLLERGVIDPRPLIDARFSLAEGLAAFERASARGALKVLLEPPRSPGPAS